jgi:DNA-binding NtrC family response regulator
MKGARIYLHALAYLYDHFNQFPNWMRKLSPSQIDNIAQVMTSWHEKVNGADRIVPLRESEKRAITRALSLCEGDVVKAAAALRIGKTTLYRKMKKWGYSVENRRLIHQASVLGETATGGTPSSRENHQPR